MAKPLSEQIKQGWPMVLLLVASIWFVCNFSVSVDVSRSLDEKGYLISNNKIPKRADYIEFMPPETSRAPKGFSFVKIVKGIAGDKISIKDRDVYINDEFIGTAKERSKDGAELAVTQEMVIPEGHYFVWTPHEYSYDSRYADIGLIPAQLIHGIAYPISIKFLAKKLWEAV